MSQVWDDLALERQGLHDPPGSLPDLLHRRVREKVVAWAMGLPQGTSVLDLGCGAGLLALRLAELRPDLKVIGMDISQGMLDAAAGRSPKKDNPAWMLGDARRWPLPDQSVDAAIAMELLVHLGPRELQQFYAEARRVCRRWLVVELKDHRSLRLVLWLRDLVDRLAPVGLREYLLGLRTQTDRIPVNLHRPEGALPHGYLVRLDPWPFFPAPSRAYVIAMGEEDV